MATISRADRFTQTQKSINIYSDFLDDFSAHPITGDISRVTNEQSIKQSIRNLVMTNYGERLFQPTIGSNILGSLFEFNDLTTASDLQFYISETIRNNEPRASLESVNVTETPDSNYVKIDILFSIINSQTIQTLNLILKRVR